MAFAASRQVLIAIACCACFASAAARPLDRARVHADYHNGDFEKVIRELKAFLKSGRKCARADSLFVEKHLAVVYAADPATRELGRYHMFRLLDLAPGSDLLDMFVGEEVDAVFDKVRKEHALRQASKRVAAAAVSAAAKASPPAKAWTTAGAAPARSAEPARSKPTWDAIASAPARLTRSASAEAAGTADPLPASAAPASRPDASQGSGSRAGADRPAGFSASGSPAWKEPGLWIGGGAALAVVAFTLYQARNPDPPEAKTYVVPSTAAR